MFLLSFIYDVFPTFKRKKGHTLTIALKMNRMSKSSITTELCIKKKRLLPLFLSLKALCNKIIPLPDNLHPLNHRSPRNPPDNPEQANDIRRKPIRKKR